MLLRAAIIIDFKDCQAIQSTKLQQFTIQIVDIFTLLLYIPRIKLGIEDFQDVLNVVNAAIIPV